MDTKRKRPGRKNRIIAPEDAPNQAQALRIQQEKTLAQIASAIKVSDASLNQFELSGTGIGRLKQFALADALQVELQDLLRPGKNFAENIRLLLE